MGIHRLYKIVDATDEENQFYLYTTENIGDIMDQFANGILNREQLLDTLSRNDIPYSIIYPEDFEVIEG